MNNQKQLKGIFKTIIFIAVLLIPVIYSFFYLKSYWDPYGHLSDIKVGIVNLDKGLDGQNRGNEFEEELKKSGTFDFVSVKNSDDAANGLGEDKYYAVITIPENFSETLNSASSENKQISTITYTPNKRKNYLASQILNSALKTIELNLESKVSKEVTATLSESLKDVPENLQKIADGAEQINDGAISLSDGLQTLSDGVNTLDSKYTEFDNGIKSANKGSKDLSNGIKQVNDGIDYLASGANTLGSAVSQVNNGAHALAKEGGDGIKKLTSGIDALDVGAKSLNDGVSQYVNGTEALAEGLNQYITGTEQVAAGINAYVDGAENLAKGTSSYIDGMSKINDNKTIVLKAVIAAAESNPELAQLAAQSQAILNAENNSGLNESSVAIKSGANSLIATDMAGLTAGGKIKYGASQLTMADKTGMSAGQKLRAGANQLVGKDEDGVSAGDKLKAGSKTLSDGTTTLKNGASSLYEITNGIGTLKAALDQIDDGTTSLVDGVGALQLGNLAVEKGAETLADGIQTLNDSSSIVKDSLEKLSVGAETAVEGSQELKEGTYTFKTEIQEGLKTAKEEIKKVEGLDEYVQDPIKIEEKSYGEVDSYGVAFAPLFISIGLWVGALMCYVVLYYDQKHRFGILDHDTKKNRIIQNFIYMTMGAVMGIITGVILKAGLGYSVESMGIYIVQCMLAGLVFMSVIQFLIRNFGDVGKFIALIILVLQLAASGGTFPVETIDNGFKGFTGILPMTYTIRSLRDALVSTDHSLLVTNTWILVGILITIFALGTICEVIKGKIKKSKEA